MTAQFFDSLTDDHNVLTDYQNLTSEDIDRIVSEGLDEANEELEAKLAKAEYPVRGILSTDLFEDEESYKAWLNEIMKEEAQAMRKALEGIMHMQTWPERVEMSDSNEYATLPECPICGQRLTEDDFNDTVGCHHYLSHYSDWFDDEQNASDYADESAYAVRVNYGDGGDTYFFFMEQPVLDGVVTSVEAAEITGMAEITIRKTCERKSIMARKSGSTWLMLKSDVIRKWGEAIQYNPDDLVKDKATGHEVTIAYALEHCEGDSPMDCGLHPTEDVSWYWGQDVDTWLWSTS